MSDEIGPQGLLDHVEAELGWGTVGLPVARGSGTGVNYHLFDPAATTSTLTVGQSAPVAADEGTEAVVDPQAETAASEPAKPASVVEEFDTIARRMREIREAEGRQAPA